MCDVVSCLSLCDVSLCSCGEGAGRHVDVSLWLGGCGLVVFCCRKMARFQPVCACPMPTHIPHHTQVLLGGPALLEPRLLAAVRGLVATYQSEVENLTLEVLGSWDRPLNKQNEVRRWFLICCAAAASCEGSRAAWLKDSLPGSHTTPCSDSF